MAKDKIAKSCSIENCGNKHLAREMCHNHYYEWKRDNAAECSIDNCSRASEKKGWCNMHYKRWLRHGDVEHTFDDPEIRFWMFVDKSPGFGKDGDCWKWLGCLHRGGYGRINVGGKKRPAHCYSFYLEYGHYPKPQGLHKCNNATCVRPSHIEEGTQEENMIYRSLSGNGTGKKMPEQVLSIRQRYANGERICDIATDYGDYSSTICNIVHRQTYKYL